MAEKIPGITKELLEKCVRCGSCRQVCPVFNVTKEEPSVARGKIFLADMINRGVVELDREAAEFFNLCTTCLRCAEICPVMVDYERIIIPARAQAVKKFGLPPEKKLAVELFSNQKLLNATTLLSSVTRFLFKRSKSPQNRLLPFKVPRLGKVLLPEPKTKPFNKGQWFKAEKEKARITFFTGCMFNNFYTETAENVVKVLNKLGYSVYVPKEQVCCGAPAFFSGDLETFKKLKNKNENILKGAGTNFVMTACATCGHILKSEYTVKAVEFIEILFENLEEIGKWKFPERRRATWHHPCHIVRGQKIPRNYPIDVLKVLGNVEFVELEEADNCCGMGGSFKLSHPEISREIQLKKAKNIEKTKADLLITECPGCVMNIAEGLERVESNTAALHIADLLAQSL